MATNGVGWGAFFLLARLTLRQRHTAVAAGDVIEDALYEDDADVNSAGDVGQKLVEEIVEGVEAIAGYDADAG